MLWSHISPNAYCRNTFAIQIRRSRFAFSECNIIIQCCSIAIILYNTGQFVLRCTMRIIIYLFTIFALKLPAIVIKIFSSDEIFCLSWKFPKCNINRIVCFFGTFTIGMSLRNFVFRKNFGLSDRKNFIKLFCKTDNIPFLTRTYKWRMLIFAKCQDKDFSWTNKKREQELRKSTFVPSIFYIKSLE